MAATVADLVAEAKCRIENLDPEEAERELAMGDIVLVDLREPGERELDRIARTILYCASGGRSALACGSLAAPGYTDVAHLDGGFNAWVAAGKPVERV
jgi:rhodanese-related sulfurtransferase